LARRRSRAAEGDAGDRSLYNTSPGLAAPAVAGFRQGLSETGYVEGQNLVIEYRFAEGRYDLLPALAADLVGRKVNLILAAGDGPALAAKNATSTIPIIFSSGIDPVRAGLVASFARPGGNLTGVSGMNIELLTKRIELLSELVPQAGVIALRSSTACATSSWLWRHAMLFRRSIFRASSRRAAA
jgi:putative ABC transport system substrate-binding protein